VFISSKSEVTPVRIGLLIDYLDDDGRFDENILPSLQLVADEYVEQGLLERPVEFVVRAVQGLPNGSFRAVRNAFFELVEQDSLVIFGPWVSENGAPLRRYVEDLAEVACITMAASETMLGDWVFGLPAGSMEEEPIIMTTVAAYDGDLDDTKVNPRQGTVSMRWTLLMFIQEFARHAGHGDILREQIERPAPNNQLQ
jgi:branched-chain amino acid transport system substrate-binding protein